MTLLFILWLEGKSVLFSFFIELFFTLLVIKSCKHWFKKITHNIVKSEWCPFRRNLFVDVFTYFDRIDQNTSLISTSTSTYIISLAGQIGWIVSISPDVVKSTIQTSEKPLGMIETTKQIVASRGIRGLFAGVEVRTYACSNLFSCKITIFKYLRACTCMHVHVWRIIYVLMYVQFFCVRINLCMYGSMRVFTYLGVYMHSVK